MHWGEFILLFSNHILLYFSILISIIALYVIVFKHVYISYLDPLIFSIIPRALIQNIFLIIYSPRLPFLLVFLYLKALEKRTL
jgi:hypothetical protein